MRHYFISFFAIVLTASLPSGAASQQTRPAAERQAAREVMARERARRDLLRDLEHGQITLPEAARRTHGTLVLDRRSLNCFPQSDLRQFVHHSSLVVVGRPFAARVELTADRRSLTTIYSVQVDDTFEASRLLPFVRHLTLSVPGGRMDFDDGASAEILSGYPLVLGDRYVLFLVPERRAPLHTPATLVEMTAIEKDGEADDPGAIYTPMSIDQGVFHLQADGMVRSYVYDGSDRIYAHGSEAAFLANVKAAVTARRVCVFCLPSPVVRFSSSTGFRPSDLLLPKVR